MAVSAFGQNHKIGPPSMQNFILTERLGQGSYATVYKGFRKGNIREVVAVKCILKSTLSKASTDNLLKEIEILKSQHHEHIVQLKDFQWSNDYIFIILEHCSGGDLSMYIRKYKRLPEHIARKFLRQLALALQFLHQQHIAHMDLKPQNLLLHSKVNPILKVGDFGFAQTIIGKQNSSNLRGSPLYMAVEMFISDTYGPKVDLWSIGVILYETIFGYAPFASRTNEELELKILSCDPIKIPNNPPMSQNCSELLNGLLQRDPSKRISFNNFFQHPFIDLEHTPSSESLPKAIQFATKAVEYDTSGKVQDAVREYCRCLDYFLPAIEFERDNLKKEKLRQKVKQYIDRAEELKIIIKNKTQEINGRQSRTQLNGSNGHSLLIELASENALISSAIIHSRYAESFDRDKKYRHALCQYETAIEIYINVLSTDLNSNAKIMIRSEASVLMARAEELSSYQSIFDDNNEIESNNASENPSRWSKCAVQ